MLPPEIGSDKLEKKGRRRPLKTILQYKALEVVAAVVFLYRIAFVAQNGVKLDDIEKFYFIYITKIFYPGQDVVTSNRKKSILSKILISHKKAGRLIVLCLNLHVFTFVMNYIYICLFLYI